MDGKLSYIPKMQPSVLSDYHAIYKTSGVGLLIKLAVFLLIVSLLVFGGAFLLKRVTLSEIEGLSVSLEKVKASFDEGVLGEMEALGATITFANKMVSDHAFVSNIMGTLEDLIIDDLKLNSFSYSFPGSSVVSYADIGMAGARQDLKIILNGQAKNYLIITQQADVFKNNSDRVKNFSFSRFVLDETGNVSFALELSVDRNLLNEFPGDNL